MCQESVVEDEKHFLLSCGKYNSERAILINSALKCDKNFLGKEENAKLEFLINSSELTYMVANFLFNAHEIRRTFSVRVTPMGE